LKPGKKQATARILSQRKAIPATKPYQIITAKKGKNGANGIHVAKKEEKTCKTI